MPVLIKNCLTEKFLGPTGRWVADLAQARDFEKTLRAWTEIEERHLSGGQIVSVASGAPDLPLARINEVAVKTECPERC